MIIKIIGLFLLTMGMFGIGYLCGWILTALKYETGGDKDDELSEVQ